MSVPLLAAKLVEFRQQKGCSQQEIADYLGVTREAYSHYERNTREPNLEIIIKLSLFYQIEISELINETTIPVTTMLNTTETASSNNSSSALGDATVSGTFMLSNNINHFLKLFTGRNTSLDLTNITKEDITILAQYKKLDRQDQKEIRQYIKFKCSRNKKK